MFAAPLPASEKQMLETIAEACNPIEPPQTLRMIAALAHAPLATNQASSPLIDIVKRAGMPVFSGRISNSQSISRDLRHKGVKRPKPSQLNQSQYG